MTPHDETALPERALTLPEAAEKHGGAELSDDDGYEFHSATDAAQAADKLGADLRGSVPEAFLDRTARLRPGKHDRLVCEIPREDGDVLPGWVPHKTRKIWIKVFRVRCDQRSAAEQLAPVDRVLRHVVSPGSSGTWFYLSDSGDWTQCREGFKILCFLKAHGVEDERLAAGLAVRHPWHKINLPFQPEFPGNRQWNREAARLQHVPKPGPHPHWDLILQHAGRGLDLALASNEWAQRYGITGAGYLLRWFASVVRHPHDALPYIALVGEQNGGKSILHEAFREIVVAPDDVVVLADRSLTSGFNGELERSVIAVVEETDLSRDAAAAYNRIKEWVTGRHLAVRRLYHDQYAVPNTVHWIQCANSVKHLPIFPGDTRITVIHVLAVENEIPKGVLLQRLRNEAGQFTHTLMTIPIPPTDGRLRLPCITTATKTQAINEQHPIAAFVEDACIRSPESTVDKSALFDAWQSWCELNDGEPLSKESFGRRLLSLFPSIATGRRPRSEGQRTCYHGIALKSVAVSHPVEALPGDGQ
jgi:hypothetical protein